MTKHTSYSVFGLDQKPHKYLLTKCLFSILLIICLFPLEGIAQNNTALSCNGHLNVSLNSNCEYIVRSGTVLSGSGSSALSGSGTFAGYTIMLTDHYDVPIDGTTITSEHLGQTLSVKIIDNGTSNSCWGSIFVEDKMAPTIDCSDVDIICLDMDEYLPTVVDNCDSEAYAVQVGQQITISDCPEPTIPGEIGYLKKFKRTYVAEDKFGYRSDTCSQTIKVLRIDTNKIVIPPHFEDVDTDEDHNSFVCNSDYPVDAEGHPHPDTTGVPQLMNADTLIALWPNIKDPCNARMDYKDFVVGKDGCLTKIMREWTYYDACSDFDEIFVRTQTIWIRDTEAPELIDLHPIVITGSPISGNGNAHGWGLGNSACEFSVSIPPITGTDKCSGIQRYEVLVDNKLVLVDNGGIVELAADTFELMYVAFDGCGSSDTSKTELIVLDNSAPVAVCDRHSVIGLTNDGTVEVEAFVFDDGSFDDCGLHRMEVARMGDIICDTLDYDFGPSIKFCCDDLNRENMVVFRVWDFTGRHNDCMVTVEIQDKTGQSASCPGDLLIDCDHPYTLTDLSEFGEAAVGGNCSAKIHEIDPIVELDDCNRGTILRRWAAKPTDTIAVCFQEITVSVPYTATVEDVIWPDSPVDTSGACGIDLLPANLPTGAQRPTFQGNVCDLYGASYKDEIFNFDNTGSCMKILRTWTVINWCASGDNSISWAQTIKVNNTEGPTIRLDRDNQDEICTFDTNCKDGPITLRAEAFDDCTRDEALRARFILDAFNDGIIDDTITRSGSEIDITQDYPIGTHRAIFSFTDECGNVSTRQHIFTIKNCKAPTCALIDGLSISLQAMDMDGDGTPDNEMACLWASDFDASSVGACTDSISFYFNEAGTDGSHCFSCCDTGENLVKVWVFDEFGNSTFCETTVNVYDHNDVDFCVTTIDCPDPRVTVRECNPDLRESTLGKPTVGDNCSCDLQTNMSEEIRSTTQGCRVLVRTWTTNCSGSEVPNDCEQRITIRNESAPTLTNCPGHMNVNLGNSGACEAFVNLREPTLESGCNDNVTITHNSQFADMQGMNASGIYPVGETTVVYTATNECGNSSQCTFTVNIRGGGDLTCRTRDITVSILNDGSVTVGPSQLDNGSTNTCGEVSITGRNTTFECSDAGTTQSVVYFIDDNNGNRESCRANVTINPVALPECNSRSLTVSLNAGGTITVDPTTLFNGSGGGVCSDFGLGGNPVTFDCSDAGTTQSANYTITTPSSQTITCTGTIIINDESMAVCTTQDITVSLGANGTVTVDPTSLYNGNAGNGVCNDFTLGGNPITYNCSDAGTIQSVNYTITTSNGQSMTCTGSVSINDEVMPVCTTQDITVSLGANGTVTIDPTSLYIGNAGNGVCNDFTLGGNPLTFDCSDAGITESVNYTITSSDGQSMTCTGSVTINSEGMPVCTTQDITVSLGANGTITIDPTSLYNGGVGSGVCGEFSLGGNPIIFDCDEAGTTQSVSYTINPTNGDIITCTGSVSITAEAQPTCASTDITVSLGDNGSITVDPTTLFEGNTQGVCGSVNVTGTPVTYNCCDAGQTNTVTYSLNNAINCSASVTINDEPAPTCSTTDITVSLNANGTLTINPSTLYNGTDGICFDIQSTPVVYDCDDAGTTQVVSYSLVDACNSGTINCQGNVIINPVDGVMITCPADQTVDCGTDLFDLSVFGTATATAGCGGANIDFTENTVTNLGVCNMGVITRTFTAIENGDSESCVQIITVSGPSNPITEANITWPTSPISINDCSVVAPQNGSPDVDTDNAECSNISMSSVDSDLINNDNTACQGQITRTWTVIDSCQLDGSGAGIFTFQQIFEFIDDENPVITLPNDITLNTAAGQCEVEVDIDGIIITDNCDESLTITNDSPFADTNNSANINGTYGVGVHVINFTATDNCENVTERSFTITVESEANTGFTFECKKKVFPITDNRTVTVNIDSITCIFTDCLTDIVASFDRQNDDVVTRTYDCSIINDIATSLYFHQSNNVIDSCRILVTISDPGGFCTSALSQSDISGFIRTEEGEGLGLTKVELQGSELPNLETDENGFYAFPSIVNGGSYTVVPEKNDEHLNGVSTLDLILIQKHILGLDIIESPYKMIAADINNSRSITAVDIVELRKLILGIYDEFPNNTSWKSIDATYVFEDSSNPLAVAVPEEYEIFSLNGDMDVDFIGVKIGDVNGNAKPNEFSKTEIRSASTKVFKVETSDEGEYVKYSFRSNNYKEVLGFQLTLDFGSNLEYNGFESKSLSLTEANIGQRYASQGKLTMSYNNTVSESFFEDDILFSLVFKKDISQQVHEDLFISDVLTKSEIYTANEISKLDIENVNSFVTHITELYQNNPNPWRDETVIEFSLAKRTNVSINIYDVSGRKLYNLNQEFGKGTQAISLSKSDLNNYKGVAYYELITKDIKAIKSMILIE